MKSWDDFKNVWIIDFEFLAGDGNPQQPICYVGQNLATNKIVKHWINGSEKAPEYSIDDKTLIIAYFASAEIGCHHSLNFKIPMYIIDLFAEFRCLTNGQRLPSGKSLLGALNYYGISSIDTIYKDTMRNRILQGPPYNQKEQEEILTYCQKDVEMTSKLFLTMKKDIDFPYALLRGKYMAAIAAMEFWGIPVDASKLQELSDYWELIRDELIWRVDQKYNVFEGTTLKIAKFNKYIIDHNIPWEYTPTGLPKTDAEYLGNKIKAHPELRDFFELRQTLSQLRLSNFPIGDDGRNRCMLSPFRSKTARNYPKTSEFIFGSVVWTRNLIKPPKNKAIAYIDYAHQEIGIAAALSSDPKLKDAYNSGDPYVAFAKMAGAIPPNGTKQTHPQIREKFKRCMLAINYGMSTKTFAQDVKIPLIEAKYIIKTHKQKFKKYWEWNTNFIDIGMLSGLVKTRFNWFFNTAYAKYRTLMNWPMQAHGSDILRLAICLCIDNGIKIIAPVHDAILIEAPLSEIDTTIEKAKKCMEDASSYILDFHLRTDAKIVKYPEHYTDPRGNFMWKTIWDILGSLSLEKKQKHLLEKMETNQPLDHWEASFEIKPKDNLSKARRGQKMMRPQTFTEKKMLERIKQKSNLSHMEIMHLIRESRKTDYDLEHKIDWKYMSYQNASKQIKKDIDPTKKKPMKELYGDIYQYA